MKNVQGTMERKMMQEKRAKSSFKKSADSDNLIFQEGPKSKG
jgi:hypothetical protein